MFSVKKVGFFSFLPPEKNFKNGRSLKNEKKFFRFFRIPGFLKKFRCELASEKMWKNSENEKKNFQAEKVFENWEKLEKIF